MSWQWWTAQGFAFVGLIFIIISFQQKSTIKLVWFKFVSTFCVFVGFLFFGNIPAILMNGAGVLRNSVAVYFAYKPQTNKAYKYIAGGMIVSLLVALNIVFWKDYFNLYSMILGTAFVFTYLQPTAGRIRYFSIVSETGAVVYYSLLFAPMNIAIEATGLISAIVGIFRIDRPERFEREMKEEVQLQDEDEEGE